MYKILKVIFFITFTLWIFISKSHSATGAADVYKITMRKVELCTASTGVTNCDNAVVIGSGDKVVDVASAADIVNVEMKPSSPVPRYANA